MTTLYNCKHSGDQYRITKFVDGEPEGSYLVTLENCDCPAGERPSCRHRQMLPRFIDRDAVNTGWMWDHDRGGWTDMRTEDELELMQAHSVDQMIFMQQEPALPEPAPAHVGALAKPWRRF